MVAVDRLKFGIAAAGLCLALAVTGCQGSPPAPPATSGSATPSASPTPDASKPTPATSTSPARNVPAPVLPAAAKRETKEGLRAFADYWFETYNYGLHTGDFKAFWAVTNPDCGSCKNFAKGIPERYKAGGWIVGGEVAIRKYSDQFRSDVNDTYGPLMTLDEKKGTAYNSAGVADDSIKPGDPEEFLVMYTRFKDGAWWVADFGSLGGN